MSQKEVVIIGAGVIGCSIAYHLTRQGVPSQIIERDSIAARASGKSWGLFVHPALFLLMEGRPPDQLLSMPEGGLRPWLDLVWSGYHRLPDIVLELKEKGGIDVEYGELSYVRIALSESEEKAYKSGLSRLNSAGIYTSSWLDANDLKEIFPDINPQVRGGLSSPSLQFEPYRYTLGLAQAAERMGANFRQGEAVGFRSKGSKITSVILATGTEIEADVFILAMGPWIKQGTAWLGKEIPIRINREQCLRLELPERFPPFAIRISTVATVPKVNGNVLLGLSGLPDMQSDFSGSLTTEEAKAEILDDALELLPMLKEAKLVEHRGDFEGWAPPPNNIQPVIGQLPEWENVYIAARFGTLGMIMSLGTGQALADLVLAGGRIPDRIRTMLDILSPARL